MRNDKNYNVIGQNLVGPFVALIYSGTKLHGATTAKRTRSSLIYR